MTDRFVLPSAKQFIVEKCEKLDSTYMPHKTAIGPGLTEDFWSKHLAAQTNLLVSPEIDENTDEFRQYNKGKAARANSGFSNMFVLSLAFSLLCNDSNLPATTLGKHFDDSQRYTSVNDITGTSEEMDFKTCWWRNVTNLLKTFEDQMTTNKFMYLFGFPSATAMSAKQHLTYYRTPDDHLRAIGKWASNVISHGVSTTIDHKVRQNKAEAKYSYQLMLMQHFTKKITFYRRNKKDWNGIKVDGKLDRGRIKKMGFFMLPKEKCGDHLSMVGWLPYDKVITDARQYWMLPPADPMVESLENDGEEDGDE